MRKFARLIKTLDSTNKTNLKVDFGGGLKSDEDLHIAFESGANQVTGGSIVVKSPEIFLNWLNTYGSDKIILGADARNEKIAVGGWFHSWQSEYFSCQLYQIFIPGCLGVYFSHDNRDRHREVVLC